MLKNKKTTYFQYGKKYCPYCYQKLSEVTHYFCASCKRSTETSGNVFTADSDGVPFCLCGAGRMRIKCSNEACRNANNIIQPEDTSVVVISGVRSSGKSTYLLDIVNSEYSDTGVFVVPKTYRTILWRDNGIRDMKDLISLESTLTTDPNYSSVVSIEKSKDASHCFSLSDRPGEETQNMDKLLGLNYMFCADYIIILLDLLNIPGVKDELTEKGIKYSSESELVQNKTIIETITETINQKRGKEGRKVPVFVGIAKWDYIEAADLSPRGFSIGCSGVDTASLINSKNKFDAAKWKQNSNIVRNFLIEHGESEFVNLAENFFKKVHYFAFSSYGNVPAESEGTYTPPVHNSRHIMDPFYYILMEKKIL